MECCEALHEVFLDSAAGGNDTIDHFMLGEIADDFAITAGDHV